MSSMNNFVSSLDLRKLRYMLALAEHGSFSQAALALNITQSALSRSIQALEDAVEVRLFERSTRSVNLSSAGKIALEAAQQTLSSAESFYKLVRSHKPEIAHAFNVGLGTVMASVFGPILLRGLTKNTANISLALRVDAPERLYDLLLDEEIDVVVGTKETTPESHRLSSETVAMIPRSFFARADHPLANRKSLTTVNLKAFPGGVSFPLPQKIVQSIVETYEIKDLNDLFQTKSNHHEALVELMLTSDMVVFGAGIAYFNHIRAGRIVRLDVQPIFPHDMPLTITHLAGKCLPAVANSLYKTLKESTQFTTGT